ncbi:X2-like carbohydrate binding domain-containing protein [Cohnella cellulosilytica]|uniref:X2-like carbohydrate binding domain-containing protein n=2 Tax=Cohnella cellulosilytica TaxID=986710 RepID=A0ABW2F846_9BACL
MAVILGWLCAVPVAKPAEAASPATVKVTQIAAAQDNSIALKSDGTVIVWGTKIDSWAKPPAGLKDVVEVYAKDTTFMARKSNGTVAVWGGNDAGETNVPPGLNKVISMAAAGKHTLTVRETSILPGAGEVIGWGLNGNGQSTIPDAAKSSVTKVAAGAYYSMALKYNGTVVDWGTNGSGATSMPAGLSGVVAIDAGYMYALALKSNGTVVAWGKEYNGNGILNVPAGLNDVVAISANEAHALALKGNGTVVGWGDNQYGKAIPPAGLEDVIAISAGRNHSLALKRDGTVVSWGLQTSVPGDNELIGLTLAEGASSPAFSPSVTSYHYDIAPGVSSVHIKADLKDSAYSALYINDQLQPSGQSVEVTVPPTGSVIKVRVEPYMKPPKTYTLTVSRDREPPVIHFDPDGSAVPLRTITTAVQVTDATSGIDASTLEYAWSDSASAPVSGWDGFSLLPATQLAQFTHTGADGNWYLHVRARDYAGNSASKTSAPFLIDNSPPVVSVTMKTEDDNAVYPENTWTGKNVVITATATDSLSGIATLKYTLDGGKTWSDYSDLEPVTLTESGVHTIIFQASDAIGNVKLESRTVNISKGNFKLTPTMNKVNPDGSDGDAYKSGEWTNGSVKVLAAAEALENGPPIVTWSLNGEGENPFGLDAVFWQTGMNTVVFKVTDQLGNSSLSIPLAINIDKTPPTVAFSPDGNGTSARAASVTATVYDAGGSGLVISTLEYVWTQSNTTKPTDGWQLLSNGSLLTKEGVDGDWYLHVQGKDAAGNEVHAVSERFVLDNSALNSTISPSTADFDKNTTAQADIAITLSLNGNTLTGIRNESEELVRNTDYAVLGNTVMISRNYLATQPVGTTSLTFSFTGGVERMLTIAVSDTTVIPDENTPIISSATISPKAVRYDLDFPGDISAKITWNSAASVTNVVYGHVLLTTPADYSVSGEVLTIKDSYLAAQSFSEGDEVSFTIYFDQGNSAELTLDVVRNYTPGSNADLSILTVGGSRITDFDPDVLTYHVELPYGTLPGSMAATVGADADDRKAAVTITQAASLPGSATVQVTAEDEVTFKDYTVSFTLADAAPTPGTGTGTGGGGGGTAPTVTKPEIDLNGKPFDPTGIDTSKPSVTLEVEPRGGSAYASIPVSLLASFADQNAAFIIEIKTPYGSYRLPVHLASLIPSLKELLVKNNLTVEEVSFKISLTDKSGDKGLQAALADGLPNGKVIGAMVDYHLEIVNTKTGRTIGTADQFSQAIIRIIPMPGNVTAMPEQWGAFRYNGTTKKFEFVPATAVKLDGMWYVMIHSYSNSVYMVAENAVSFADVQEKHWAKSDVELAAAKGLVEGVGEGRYDPGKAVTRAEFTVMLVRALGRGGASANDGATSAGGNAPYRDIGAGAWYADAVAKAKALGLLDFAKGGSFKPNQALTREEMASMLAAVVALDKRPTATEEVNANDNSYKDMEIVNPAYQEDVRLMIRLQIMTGVSADSFDPQGQVTRAQAATVFIRTLQALGMVD